MAIQSKIYVELSAASAEEAINELYETYPDTIKSLQVIPAGNSIGMYSIIAVYDDGTA